MKGFQNLGNTCYMNSAIQLLLNSKYFCRIIMKYQQKKNNIRGLAEFIKNYHLSQGGIESPKLIKDLVSDNELFAGTSQQDSAEFIIYFLDKIEKMIKRKNIYSDFEIDENSIVKCKLKDCNNISKTKYKRLFLMLSISENHKNLNDCYREYKKNEKLEDDNMWYCEKCKKKRIASKRLEINNWPTNLLIKLKRFTYDINGQRKISKSINCPLDWRHGYKLHGGIIHYGSTLDSGHYIYFGKYFNNWYIFNDTIINKIDQNQLQKLTKISYILHYIKE